MNLKRYSLIGAALCCAAAFAAPPGGSATILFAGDAMQHQAQLDNARRSGGGFDYSQCFWLISPQVRKADYAVCNLEVPLGGGPDYRGYPRFSAPDAYAEALRDAGFSLMLLANNHILDSGDEAALRTASRLPQLGMECIGVYPDSAACRRDMPLVKDIGGFRVAFLNFTYGTNGVKAEGATDVPLTDRDRMASGIVAAKEAGADITCVCIHWGLEYVMLPSREQKLLARFLADSGADLVIGSHPHVAQPLEYVDTADGRRVPVVYSLGNLISNMRSAETRGGLMAEVELLGDEAGKASVGSVTLSVHYTQRPFEGSDAFRVIPSAKADSLLPVDQLEAYRLFRRSLRRTAGL